MTTAENLEAVLAGRTGLKHVCDRWPSVEPACVSLIDRQQVPADSGMTYFENLCVASIKDALRGTDVDPSAETTMFVISSTKGNVSLLEHDIADPRVSLLWSARKIAGIFGNPNVPLVVSNACISGVSAQIAAVRLLESNVCTDVIVAGADEVSRFIVSGFQSFKALSPGPCRPYDCSRSGLNLGEAAATLILTSRRIDDAAWCHCASAIANDANHISGPSRTGEGSYRVLSEVLRAIDRNDLSFINAHGTATAYNDEMESIAIHRAGLDDIPVNGLKGFFGHTLGAAGLLETILSIAACDSGVILPTAGYSEQGTTYCLNLSDRVRQSDRKTFIKLLSGFGGTNAAIAYRKGGCV